MRLANGTVWPIPVVLSPPNDIAEKVQVNQKIALKDSKGSLLATMKVTEKYKHDKELEIPNVYRTSEDAHPGVAIVRKQGDTCLAGQIDVLNACPSRNFPNTVCRPQRRARRLLLATGARSPRSRRVTPSIALTNISPSARWR